MKTTTTLLPLATLGLGIAIGWFAKPMPEPGSNPGAAKTQTAATPGKSEEKPLAEARPAKPARERPDPKEVKESSTKAKAMVGKMQDAAVGRHRVKLEQYAETLAENLKLSPDQREKLKSAIKSQVEEMEKLVRGPGTGELAALTGKLPAFGTDALDASIAEMLSAEQQAELGSFKQRERTRRADATALKSLSQLQGIFEFKEGQRDQVYEILTQSAEASMAESDPANQISEMFTEGLGVEMDPYGLGLQKLLTESMKDSMLQNDEQAAMKKFREVIEKRIDEKVDELRPVLDEAQLERYRAELKAKGAGPYSSLMMAEEE